MQVYVWQRFAEMLVQECANPMLLFDQYLKVITANQKLSRVLNQTLPQILNHSVDSFFPGLIDISPDNDVFILHPEKAVYHTYIVEVKEIPDPDGQAIGGTITLVPHALAIDTLAESGTDKSLISLPNLNPNVSQTSAHKENRKCAQFGNSASTSLNRNIIQQNVLYSLIENSEEGITIFDQLGHIITWNSVMERNLGKKREQVLGKNIFDLLPKSKNKIQGKSIRQVLAGKSFVLERVPYLTHTGFFNASFLPILDNQKQVIGGIAIVRDITEYLALQDEHLSRQLRLQNKSMLAVWITQISERKRIAEKIHNSLGQLLYGFKMEFRQKGYSADVKTRQLLEALLDEIIAETKTIAFELMPAMLEDFGLEATLEEMVNKYSNLALTLSYHVSGLTRRLDRNLEIIIYTVIQELTNNVIKHALASKARIYLELEGEEIIIKVIDNGIGFEKGKLVFAQESTGLRNIKNSLKLFGGEIKISSQIGKGTLITVRIPVK